MFKHVVSSSIDRRQCACEVNTGHDTQGTFCQYASLFVYLGLLEYNGSSLGLLCLQLFK